MPKKPTQEEKTLGMLSHLLGIFAGFFGPLILFLALNPQKGFAYENAKHALNFHISLLVYGLVGAILIFVVVGIFLLILLSIFAMIAMILGTIRANQGEIFVYPLEIPFIR